MLGAPGLGDPLDELLGVLEPLEGIGAEVPLEEGAVDRAAELEPLLPDERFWLEPELSQAASARAESNEAAISHVLPINASPMALVAEKLRNIPCHTPLQPITGRDWRKFPA